MPSYPKTPPPRSLDVYRLVVARGVKQTQVAQWFSVSPVRVCQIVSRVRRWVDDSIGEWLFPRRDDLRFYAAVASAQIRVHELPSDPEAVLLAGSGWSYRREAGSGQQPAATSNANANANANNDATKTLLTESNLSAAPLNLLESPAEEEIGASPCGEAESTPPYVEDLGRRLAELLIVWQKSRRLSGAFKSWR